MLGLTPFILLTSWSAYRSTINQSVSSQSIASVQLNRSSNIAYQLILLRIQEELDIERSPASTQPSYVQRSKIVPKKTISPKLVIDPVSVSSWASTDDSHGIRPSGSPCRRLFTSLPTLAFHLEIPDTNNPTDRIT